MLTGSLPRIAGAVRLAANRFPGFRELLWLGALGFLLNGNWEWLQTPFYDDGGVGVNTVVWYRFHCTLVDVVILLVCAMVVSIAEGGGDWLGNPRPRPLIALSLLGTAYTALSEEINVGLQGSWGYSDLMPRIPGSSIGVVPLLQWLILPALAVWLVSRLR